MLDRRTGVWGLLALVLVLSEWNSWWLVVRQTNKPTIQFTMSITKISGVCLQVHWKYKNKYEPILVCVTARTGIDRCIELWGQSNRIKWTFTNRKRMNKYMLIITNPKLRVFYSWNRSELTWMAVSVWYPLTVMGQKLGKQTGFTFCVSFLKGESVETRLNSKDCLIARGWYDAKLGSSHVKQQNTFFLLSW